ncbi:MAG: APC family permease [Candidatus Bathyarchaeia archaeon]
MKNSTKLKPTISLWSATTINIGAIIGSGIFVAVGVAASSAGSALAISMAIAAAVAALTALSFAELASWKPAEGSVYAYAYELVSPFAGFITGWMWLASNTFAGAAVALGFASYFSTFAPNLPVNTIAALLCLIFAATNFVGTRQSTLINNVLVTAKLTVLVFFIIFGLLHVNAANYAPFTPFSGGTLLGVYFVFFAYAGFARVVVLAEEIKDAKRNVPKAVLLSLAISTIVYILVGLVAVGLAGATTLADSHSPLADAINITGNTLAVQVVSFGGLVATASVLLTSILGVSRVAYAMAKRRDMPQWLSKLHGRFGTPYYSIWLTGVVMALLVLLIDLKQVVAISTFAILFYYAIANLAAFKLHSTNRRFHRSLSILGFASCLAFLLISVFVSLQTWISGVTCLASGIIAYAIKCWMVKHRLEIKV